MWGGEGTSAVQGGAPSQWQYHAGTMLWSWPRDPSFQDTRPHWHGTCLRTVGTGPARDWLARKLLVTIGTGLATETPRKHTLARELLVIGGTRIAAETHTQNTCQTGAET